MVDLQRLIEPAPLFRVQAFTVFEPWNLVLSSMSPLVRLSLRPVSSKGITEHLHHMEAVDRDLRFRKPLPHWGPVAMRHVHGDAAHLVKPTPVPCEHLRETFHGVVVLAVLYVQNPCLGIPFGGMGEEDGYVVVSPMAVFVDTHFGDVGEVPGGKELSCVVFQNPPEPVVGLSDSSGDRHHRHVLQQCKDHGLHRQWTYIEKVDTKTEGCDTNKWTRREEWDGPQSTMRSSRKAW